MDNDLKLYLYNEWVKNNNTKYHKYFDVWFNNLTDTQIFYYNKLWFQH